MTDVLTSPILMTCGIKSEYYIRKRVNKDEKDKNDQYRVPPFLLVDRYNPMVIWFISRCVLMIKSSDYKLAILFS